MALRNIRLVMQYDGTAYSGWQLQSRERTVQGELVEALFKLTGQRPPVIGAGRTDAGVHALGQVANVPIDHPLTAEKYRDALNYYLPEDIRIIASEEAAEDFHARFSARWRRYRYLASRETSALWRKRRWEGIPDIDFDRLRTAASLFRGDHDFSAFCVVASRQERNRCFIEHSQWRRVGPLLVYEIRGNRFLHSMVRSLVGAMINVATISPDAHPHNLTLSRLADMLATPAEQRNVFTAPAHGLYLVSVGYEEEPSSI
jgi:tRNA pseudouridine38-40 synthase